MNHLVPAAPNRPERAVGPPRKFAMYGERLSEAAQVGRLTKLLENTSAFRSLSPETRAKLVGALARWISSTADEIAWVLKAEICFVAGTLVHTPAGLRPIEEISIGDLVLTRSEQAAHDEPPVARQVVQTFTTHPDVLVHVRYRTDSGDEETLSGTANHPFYSVDRQQFVHAAMLEVGETLALPSSACAVVVSVDLETAVDGATFTTYNFAVDQTHTYFVGEHGVWVHNLDATLCAKAAKALREALDANPNLSADEQKAILRKFFTDNGVTDTSALNKHIDDAWDKYRSAAPTRKVSLGIEDHLDDFSRRHGADSWKVWAKEDPMQWKGKFYDVMNDPKAEVLFNLDGVDVWGGVTRASRNDGGATDWELLQIYSNKDWWSRIKWIKDGKAVPNPFE